MSDQIPEEYRRYAMSGAEMERIAREFADEKNVSPEQFRMFWVDDDPSLVSVEENLAYRAAKQ